jgi:hypothetical protein
MKKQIGTLRRHADTPIRRHADTPTRGYLFGGGYDGA